MPQSVDQAAYPLAPTYHDVLDMIGNTPLLELKNLDTGPCRLFVKMELLNPANSIKDRIAIAMVEAAEQAGTIKPGGQIIEATAGNTGIALAMVGAHKGYTVTVVMPDKMSLEKINHLRAMGAKVVLTRSDVEKGHPEYYHEVAARLAEETPNSVYVNQFANEANVRAHYEETGPEIWQQTEGRLDAFVAGVGSGGTLTGAGRYLREQHPDIDIVLADPQGSVLAPLVNEGKAVEPGFSLVEGVGEDFVPSILDLEIVNKAYTIPDGESFHTCRDILRKEGILCGTSSGTLVATALRYCREQTEPKTVVTFLCDNGAKYLSKAFNDYWMIDQGFIERETYGDIRDLIMRRHADREDYTVDPDKPMSQAFKLMRMYDISQMAVLDKDDRIVGILDESDLLMAITHDEGCMKRPVSDFMTSRLETIRPTASINDLMPIFRADRVAIVVDDNGQYHGLITKIDLANYLRKQLP